MEMTPAGTDRVRANTSPRVNAAIDQETAERLRELSASSSDVIERRLAELRNEWDIERVLQAEGAATALASLLLALTVNRKSARWPVGSLC